jgi:hypothetical protein
VLLLQNSYKTPTFTVKKILRMSKNSCKTLQQNVICVPGSAGPAKLLCNKCCAQSPICHCLLPRAPIPPDSINLSASTTKTPVCDRDPFVWKIAKLLTTKKVCPIDNYQKSLSNFPNAWIPVAYLVILDPSRNAPGIPSSAICAVLLQNILHELCAAPTNTCVRRAHCEFVQFPHPCLH